MMATATGLLFAVFVAIICAALVDLSPLLRGAIYPILVVSQTIQILAVAPLVVIWIGFGFRSTVMVVALFTFFPMAIATIHGLAATNPDYVEMMRSLRASRWQIWRMARLHSALPAFFSGLRLAVTYAVIAATIGEWVSGYGGLGLYMLRSKNALRTDQLFAAMLITSLLSMVLFGIVVVFERRALRWYWSRKRFLGEISSERREK